MPRGRSVLDQMRGSKEEIMARGEVITGHISLRGGEVREMKGGRHILEGLAVFGFDSERKI